MKSEAVVADLGRLVAFESVSSRAMRDLASFVADRCADLGFRTELLLDATNPDKCTVYAAIGPDTGEDGLVISGHLDVVPTEGQPWMTDPFRMVERGGKLFGRGTADMKGFVASTLQALARIPASSWKKRLALVWTHDEEVGCLGSAQFAATMASRGIRLPRSCLIGEPTEFQVLRMHPGHVGIEIEVRGVAAHSSMPELGINAIEGAAQVITEIRALAAELARERRHDLPELERPWVVLNAGYIAGGGAINIVPDRCVIRIGYRHLPGMRPEEPFERIKARVEALSLPGGSTTRLLRVTPSLLTREGTPLQSWLSPHAHTPECGAATFATDGGNLAKLGMEPLVFGPGSIGVAHKADEHIAIADLVEAVDVVERLARTACA
jgi:acetylornithine deacetylase